MLVEHQSAVDVFDRRRHHLGEMFAGERPVTNTSLAWWQLLCRDLLQFENPAHDENGGRECRDSTFFGLGELDGVPVDLGAAPHQIGEGLRRWGFDVWVHAVGVGCLTVCWSGA